MRFQDIKLSTKLLVTNLAVILTLCLAALWLENSVTTTLKAATDRVDELSKVVRLSKEWKGLADANTQRAIAAAFSQTPSMTDMLRAQFTQHTNEITVVHNQLKELANKPGDAESMSKIAELRKQILADLKEIEQLKGAGDLRAVEHSVEVKLQASLAVYLEGLEAFIQLQEVHSKEAKDAAVSAKSAAEWKSFGLMAVIAAASLAWMALVGRSIARPLQQAVQVADAIAAGDLTQDMAAGNRQDEIGKLMGALSSMGAKLRQVVSEVRHGVDSVSTAAGEIAAGNADLSSRTEQAAANLEEAAASMEELTSTVAHSADAATQASTLAKSAVAAAVRGHEVVDTVVERMREISESSARITDIIATIDGISFQTNILALNAAVEAARAGEQGRGFAVVATEVRALANRSAEAAKQIKELISVSVEKVDAGSALVARTGEAMAEIESSIKQATDMMSEISAAAKEQRDGIGQVNQSVTQLDEMTQQNAALVEQSAAAASALSSQAATLASLVAMFKVGEHAPTPAPAAVTPRPAATPAKQVARTPVVSAAPSPVARQTRAVPKAVSEGDWEEF